MSALAAAVRRAVGNARKPWACAAMVRRMTRADASRVERLARASRGVSSPARWDMGGNPSWCW
ncbi:MAG: hypothetical protein N2557_08025 [Hydrogenophilus sp.]|nr:hypothetical protein [Hydrogenophilus sp.]